MMMVTTTTIEYSIGERKIIRSSVETMAPASKETFRHILECITEMEKLVGLDFGWATGH